VAFSLFATGLADVRSASDGLSLFPDDWLAEIGGAVWWIVRKMRRSNDVQD